MLFLLFCVQLLRFAIHILTTGFSVSHNLCSFFHYNCSTRVFNAEVNRFLITEKHWQPHPPPNIRSPRERHPRICLRLVIWAIIDNVNPTSARIRPEHSVTHVLYVLIFICGQSKCTWRSHSKNWSQVLDTHTYVIQIYTRLCEK